MTVDVHPVHADPRSPLRALLPREGTAYADPFLVFHEQGPVTYGPHQAIGFPDHAHRGFETITYVIEGEQQHRDSFGHAGVLRAGDVQWMSAGAGIVHSEVPTDALAANGGRVHALQIWLNLPRARKMERPRYQDVAAGALPVVRGDGRWIRVIAGTHDGLTSPVDAGRPVLMAHLELAGGIVERCVFPPHATAIVYAMRGAATLDGTMLTGPSVAVLHDVSGIALATGPAGFSGIVLAAEPLREPVVSRGPFVMNTVAEIETAYDDLLAGRLGVEASIG